MKTPWKVLAVLAPLAVGVAAARWTDLELWYDMKEGLIAFLGFLAASLVQVMPVTANFLQADRLSVHEAERLTASLSRQQRYWVGLLSATIVAMVLVIAGAALKTRVSQIPLLFVHPMLWDISWGAVAVFLISASVSFVFVKMVGLFRGLLSLHMLRADLVLIGAKRAAAEKVAALQAEAESVGPLLPPGYGQILHPH